MKCGSCHATWLVLYVIVGQNTSFIRVAPPVVRMQCGLRLPEDARVREGVVARLEPKLLGALTIRRVVVFEGHGGQRQILYDFKSSSRIRAMNSFLFWTVFTQYQCH